MVVVYILNAKHLCSLMEILVTTSQEMIFHLKLGMRLFLEQLTHVTILKLDRMAKQEVVHRKTEHAKCKISLTPNGL